MIRNGCFGVLILDAGRGAWYRARGRHSPPGGREGPSLWEVATGFFNKQAGVIGCVARIHAIGVRSTVTATRPTSRRADPDLVTHQQRQGTQSLRMLLCELARHRRLEAFGRRV